MDVKWFGNKYGLYIVRKEMFVSIRILRLKRDIFSLILSRSILLFYIWEILYLKIFNNGLSCDFIK